MPPRDLGGRYPGSVIKSLPYETKAPNAPSGSALLNSQPLRERVTPLSLLEDQEGVPFLASNPIEALLTPEVRRWVGSRSTVSLLRQVSEIATASEGSLSKKVRSMLFLTFLDPSLAWSSKKPSDLRQ